MENYKLIDNVALHQYEFRIGDLIPENRIHQNEKRRDLPDAHRSPVRTGRRGVGSSLVRLALEDIERQQLRLVPLCPFVAGYVQKLSEWKRLRHGRSQHRIKHRTMKNTIEYSNG